MSVRSKEIDPPHGDGGAGVETRRTDAVGPRAAQVVEGPRGLLRRGSATDTRAKRWTIVAMSALALLAAGYWVTKSPVFSARHVEVTGASHLSRATVLRLAHVERGTNVFWFHPGAAERRLVANRWVEQARVTRSLPSTISIRVVERTPVAQVADARGGFDVVASDGTVLGRSPILGDYPTLLVNPGVPGELRAVAKVAGDMNPWLRSRVRAVDATGEQLVVRLQSGIPAYYGDATAAAAKGRALAAVLHWALRNAKTVVSIDVRTPMSPTAQLPYTPPVTVPTPSPAKKGKHGDGASSSPSPNASPSPQASASPAGGGTATRHHGRTRHPR